MSTGFITGTYNPDVLSCIANLSSDEVFTPPEIANKILDMLPQEIFSNPNTTFLDPACKSGVFLREITKRLIDGLESEIPNLEERINHILHKQVFGIAVTELTSLLSRRGVYCSKFPNGDFSVAKFESVEGNILNTPEFRVTRDYLSQKAVPAIIDFGEKGFPGVLIETIALFIDNTKKPKNTIIRSATDRIEMLQRQSYIFDKALPYWIIYRDADFDSVKDQLDLGVFDVFRDRQLTNSYFSNNACDIRVIKARNISNDGSEIVNIEGYDSYIAEERARGLGVYRFLNAENVYLTPNMTYYPRVMKKPKNTLVNGSVAILIPKDGFELTEDQMRFFSTDEYRKFYWVARNHQTRSLNVDSCSVYFFGVKKAK